MIPFDEKVRHFPQVWPPVEGVGARYPLDRTPAGVRVLYGEQRPRELLAQRIVVLSGLDDPGKFSTFEIDPDPTGHAVTGNGKRSP